jgi:hypothetical protein
MPAPTLGENWIDVLRTLKPNWDGYGGIEITNAAMETVRKFSVVPNSDGGVDLEIHHSGLEISVYIDPDGAISGASVYRDRYANGM